MANQKKSVDRLLVLPWKKSFEIAAKSIRARFLRSMVTTLSLVLAVAFLSYVRINNDAANGLLGSGEPHWRQVLLSQGYDLEDHQASVGASPKQRWIVVLSLLVCVVGIVNAQLMAVTERFREIGAMKCLGALDRFVLRLFLLEAGMQGLVGSAMGVLAGAFFALLGSLVKYGGAAWANLSWTALLTSMGFGLLVGFALSLVGVLYPAVVAARMQPVEAMRSEM